MLSIPRHARHVVNAVPDYRKSIDGGNAVHPTLRLSLTGQY